MDEESDSDKNGSGRRKDGETDGRTIQRTGMGQHVECVDKKEIVAVFSRVAADKKKKGKELWTDMLC